jgi:CDP-diacylglycerol--glycerol-3-phosphate 3-phosphatidyltransferase
MNMTSSAGVEGRVWTLSNGLSLLRVLLVYPIIRCILAGSPDDRLWAAGFIILAASTDFLDGLLARRLGQVSDVGKVIDPLADKLGIGAVAIALTYIGSIPAWFLCLALMRDVMIFAGGLYVQRTKGIILQSTMVGKWAAGTLAAYILVAVVDSPAIRPVAPFLLLGTVALLGISFALYVRRFVSVVTAS